MITQGNKQAKTARQLVATTPPIGGEICVHNTNGNWADELINLYNSVDEYGNRDNAIYSRLAELRDNQTALELKFLLDRVDNDVRKEFVDTFLKREVSNEQSCTKVEVKWAGHTDLKHRNSGRIRIYMNKNGRKELIYFKRRASFILYILYLMDAYNSENASALDITKYDMQFCKLFNKVYAYDGGQEYFNTLLGKGNSEQELLRHSLGDIRKTMGKTCEMLHEDASPYILSNRLQHLGVVRKNIVIDERLLNIF